MFACFLIAGELPPIVQLATRFHASGFSVDGIYPISGRPTAEYLLVSAAQDSHLEKVAIPLTRAKALRKLSKRLADLNIQVEFLDARSYSKIPQMLGTDLYGAAVGEAKSEAETVLLQLSTRAFPSSVYLVRMPDGAVRVRKTFCPGYRKNLERELQARRVISDPRVSAVIASSGLSIYLPWYSDFQAFHSGLLRFYPVTAVRNVIDFLEQLNARGLAMVDINPRSFLYNAEGEVVVVDFEFLSDVPPKPAFIDSADFTGLNGCDDAPRARGWNHFWLDAAGAPYRALRQGPDRSIAAYRLLTTLARLLSAAFKPVTMARKTLSALVFYWRRRSEWGIRIQASSLTTPSLSLQTTVPAH